MIRKINILLDLSLSKIEQANFELFTSAKTATNTIGDLLFELSRWPSNGGSTTDYSTPSSAYTRIVKTVKDGQLGIQFDIDMIDDIFRASRESHRIEIIISYGEEDGPSIMSQFAFYKKARRKPFGRIDFIFFGPDKKNDFVPMFGGDFQRQAPKYTTPENELFVGGLESREVVRGMRGMVPRGPRTGIL